MAGVTIRIDTRDNTERGFARVRQAVRNLNGSIFRAMTQSGEASGRSFASRFSYVARQAFRSSREIGEGIMQSIGSALSVGGSNPYVVAGIAALVATVAPAIGAALAGGIVLAFGGAFVGLGAYLLKDNEEVKSKWGETIKSLKSDFSHAADGLIPVLTHAGDLVADLGKKFAPHFKEAMDEAAPHLNDFLDRMAEGIEKFGKKAWKPLMDAFGDILDEIDIEGFFEELGDAFKDLAETVSDNKEEIGFLFNFILETIPFVIRVIDGLAIAWGYVYRFMKKTIEDTKRDWNDIKEFFGGIWDWIKERFTQDIENVKERWSNFTQFMKDIWSGIKDIYNEYIKPFVDKVVGTFKGMYDILIGNSIIPDLVNGIIGWLKKLTDPVKRAFEWIGRLKGKTIKFFQKGAEAIRDKVKDVIDWVKRMGGKTIKLAQRGGQAVIDKVRGAIRTVKDFVGKTVRVAVNGAGSAKKAVQGVIDKIRNLVGKTVNVGINLIKSGASSLWNKIFAHGGVVGHAAEGGPRSNTVLVGEQGPELVDLAPGSRVRTNSDSRRILSSGGGMSGQLQPINIYIGNEKVAEAIYDPLKKLIRTRARGNVQVALGS